MRSQPVSPSHSRKPSGAEIGVSEPRIPFPSRARKQAVFSSFYDRQTTESLVLDRHRVRANRLLPVTPSNPIKT
jgi:hypothetical protein